MFAFRNFAAFNFGQALALSPKAPHKRAIEAGMTRTLKKPGLGIVAYFAVMFSLGVSVMFASVQGDFGLFRRVEIEAEAATLAAERDRLAAEVAALENKTHRLSDTYLDLDLLDSQARDVLGLIRSDEIVLN